MSDPDIASVIDRLDLDDTTTLTALADRFSEHANVIRDRGGFGSDHTHIAARRMATGCHDLIAGERTRREYESQSTSPGGLFAGTNGDRQSVGKPGHCDRCAEVGHVRAHPDLGCSDVGCNHAH